MANSSISVTEGSGKNIATHSISESTTKEIQRVEINNSSGTEMGTSASPFIVGFTAPANYVKGTTSAITDTTSTQVIAAGSTGIKTYITSILVTNSHATVGTFVKILDGSTIIWEGYAAAAGGGFACNFPTPIVGTGATAVNAQAVTTGANFIVSIAGYQI